MGAGKAKDEKAPLSELIEDLMIERMGENDKIVTRYMADQEFQGSAFPILARKIFDAVRAKEAESIARGDSIEGA